MTSADVNVREFDNNQPIDVNDAIQQYGGNVDLFCMMLDQLEPSGLLEHIQ
jgi:hypothetical protein